MLINKIKVKVTPSKQISKPIPFFFTTLPPAQHFSLWMSTIGDRHLAMPPRWLEWLFNSTPVATLAQPPILHTKVKVAYTTPLFKSSQGLHLASEYLPNSNGIWLFPSLPKNSHWMLAGPTFWWLLQWAKFFSSHRFLLSFQPCQEIFPPTYPPSPPLDLSSNIIPQETFLNLYTSFLGSSPLKFFIEFFIKLICVYMFMHLSLTAHDTW